jgi:geranylgeranyl diphosphate synthase type I
MTWTRFSAPTIWGRTELTGKAVGADLHARKMSTPVVAALNAAGTSAKLLSRLYSTSRELDIAEVDLARELVEAAGGRRLAQAEADRRLAMAWSCVDDTDMADAPRAELRDLVAFLATRAW